MSSPDAIREVLGQIKDAGLDVDFVSAGMVKDVVLQGADATIDIELTTPACPSKNQIDESIRRAVGVLSGIDRVTVRFSSNVMARPSLSTNARLPQVKNILAIAAGKGGVGKSTVTTNLAAALHRTGARVGILDADIYGPSIPQMMGDPDVTAGTSTGGRITPAVHHGIKVISVGFFVERGNAVIWRGPMIHKLLQQFLEDVDWGMLDYLLVDLAPGTGDTQLSLSQLIPITGAVMVTTPQEVSIIDVEKAMAMWKRVEVPVIGLIENMSHFRCPSCGHEEAIFARGGGRTLAKREQVPFLGEVPILSSVRGGGDAGMPITLKEPESDIAKIFMALATDVACMLSKRNKPPPGAGIRSSKLAMIR